MKKLKQLKVFLLIPVLFLYSCDKELSNINPGAIENIDFQFLLPIAIVQTYYNQGTIAPVTAGFVAGYFDGDECVDILSNSSYFNRYWEEQLYGGALINAQEIVDRSGQLKQGLFYRGVSKILLAFNYSNATSMFGDLPFSEALKGAAFLKPKYDSQKDIYQGMLDLLNEGISDLSVGDESYNGGDLVFDGDAQKWIKNANTLKMRLYLHLAKKDLEYYSDILELSDIAMQSEEDQAIFQFERNNNSAWSLSKWSKERPGFLQVHHYFLSVMEDDPRKDKNINPETTGSGFSLFENNQEGEIIWARADAKVPLISMSELYFIQAEAMLRLNYSKTDVGNMLRKAISASMKMMEVEEEDYINYLEEYSVLSANSSEEEDLEQIINEAYKAYFGFNNIEGWGNLRRTGYPSDIPNMNIPSDLNPSGNPVERLLYPESELVKNTASLQAAQAAQDGALLDVPLWVFKD